MAVTRGFALRSVACLATCMIDRAQSVDVNKVDQKIHDVAGQRGVAHADLSAEGILHQPGKELSKRMILGNLLHESNLRNACTTPLSYNRPGRWRSSRSITILGFAKSTGKPFSRTQAPPGVRYARSNGRSRLERRSGRLVLVAKSVRNIRWPG